MKVLVDTNVLLDVALERSPFFTDSDAVVRWCEDRAGSGLIAWHSISNISYILRRSQTTAAVRGFIASLLEVFEVAPTGTAAAKQALRLDVSDFEDALQIAAALAGGADCIVTRDSTDYENSPIPSRTPTEFIDSVANQS